MALLIANILVVPAWAMLVFAPGAELTKKLLYSHKVLLVLAFAYLGFIAFGMFQSFGNGGGMWSFDQLRISFQNDHILLAAWIHYLVFDLFVGCWINQKSFELNYPNPLRIICLAFTLFFGPIGFLIFPLSSKKYKTLNQ